MFGGKKQHHAVEPLLSRSHYRRPQALSPRPGDDKKQRASNSLRVLFFIVPIIIHHGTCRRKAMPRDAVVAVVDASGASDRLRQGFLVFHGFFFVFFFCFFLLFCSFFFILFFVSSSVPILGVINRIFIATAEFYICYIFHEFVARFIRYYFLRLIAVSCDG